ncbi:MAG: MgtC/SapB family protein [Acidobacteriota bacterium]
MKDFLQLVPAEALKIVMVLFLSSLIGIEREEHKSKATSYTFGGIRTFPLIGLIGYMTAYLTNLNPIGIGIGLVVVGAFLLISYLHKISISGDAGVTTEISGLLTYLLGPLVFSEHYWAATSIVVVAALLLELKEGLESLTKKIESDEIITFTKFLLVTFVILPIVPNQNLTPLNINPFKTWLVVVAVSVVSYGSYVINKLSKGKGGALMTAVLGGAYSSTATTIVLSRRSKEEIYPRYFSGSILLSSSIMYLRIFILVFVFNNALSQKILIPCLALFIIGSASGIIFSKIKESKDHNIERKYSPKNPLDITSAVLFAFVFLIVLISTELFVRFLGTSLIYLIAALMGFSDVDPFIMSLTQTSGKAFPVEVGAQAIIIATSSNNILKGVYSIIFGEKKTGMLSFLLLLVYSLMGFAFLIFL